MAFKRCVICYEEPTNNSGFEEQERTKTEADTDTVCFIPGSDDCSFLRSQLLVIFMLRKFLEIPEEKCLHFLKQHGNPCSWIYWCDSCCAMVREAKVLFDKIIPLQKKFEALQDKSKRKIIATSKSSSSNSTRRKTESRPTAIVRQWVVEQNDVIAKEEKLILNVKIEHFDSDHDGSNTPCGSSVLNFKMKGDDCDDDVDYLPKKMYKKRVRKPATPKKKKDDPNQLENNHVTEEKKVHSCKYCPKEFSHSGSLVTHERIHTGEKPYSCKSCDKTFRSSSDLAKHDKIHKGIKPFSCAECGKSFYLRPDLRKHERIHTGERNFCCHICGKKFGTAKTLRNHVTIHTGDKPRLCTVCGKRFLNNQQLTRHQRTHTGERPFACSLCEKRFYDFDGLQKHEMFHRGEKPHICSTCGARFTQSSALYCHQRIHLDEKPYKCSVCGRQFTQSSNLKTHERIHTGERPFSCTTCGKQCISKKYLSVHEKTHTGQKDHCCTVCGKLFPQANSLNRHLKKVHLVTNNIKGSKESTGLNLQPTPPLPYFPPSVFPIGPSPYAKISQEKDS